MYFMGEGGTTMSGDMDTIYYSIVITFVIFVAGASLELVWEMWRERKNKERND